MKTWHKIAIGIIVLLIIVYAIYTYNKNQEIKRQQELNDQENPGSTVNEGTSKLSQILNSLFPFFKEVVPKKP